MRINPRLRRWIGKLHHGIRLKIGRHRAEELEQQRAVRRIEGAGEEEHLEDLVAADGQRAQAADGSLRARQEDARLATQRRPILGLDSRDLLEIVLDVDPLLSDPGPHLDAVVLDARLKSGFDSVEECFGDLTEHIFALETGLSSDPPMNWRL